MHAGVRTDPEKTLVWLNQMMKDADITVPQIAQWLGISEQQVYNWRGGKIGMKKMHFLAIARVFESVLNKDFDDYVYIDLTRTAKKYPFKKFGAFALFDELCAKPEETMKGA